VTFKYFTVKEANALLPSIEFTIDALQKAKQELDAKFITLQMMKLQPSDKPHSGVEDPFFVIECEIDFLQMEARTLMNNIDRMGAELKDIDIGLVDFPALINGEEVLLCWRLGEDRIAYYHSRESGFMGRKPITDGAE
jgi:hypothetical protein